MKVTNLSSGSKGNCTLLVGQHTTVLIDIGIGIKLLSENLSKLQQSINNIDAILITHEHSDHICGLECLTKKNAGVHIYVYADVWAEIVRKKPSLKKYAKYTHVFLSRTVFCGRIYVCCHE